MKTTSSSFMTDWYNHSFYFVNCFQVNHFFSTHLEPLWQLRWSSGWLEGGLFYVCSHRWHCVQKMKWAGISLRLLPRSYKLVLCVELCINRCCVCNRENQLNRLASTFPESYIVPWKSSLFFTQIPSETCVYSVNILDCESSQSLVLVWFCCKTLCSSLKMRYLGKLVVHMPRNEH